MLYISKWKATAILLTALICCLLAVPNFFPESTIKRWPQWAQRHIVLGLDLQGGSHILLEVDANDVRRQKLQTLQDDVRRTLREARVGLVNAPVIRGNAVEVRIRESDLQQGLAKLRELSQPLGGLLGTTGQRSLDVENVGGGLVRLTVTEPAIVERMRQVAEQSVQIIEKRLNAFGLVEPSIQRQGVDRILVQVPGFDDPDRLLEGLKPAKLTFRLVDTSMTPEQALQGRPPPESEIVNGSKEEGGRPYLLEKRVIVEGADLTDAQPGFDQRTSEPIVSFKFNSSGARKFAQVTQENVGRAVRHRARQRGHFGSRHPRADPGRAGPDFRQLHRRIRKHAGGPAARRRAAGETDHRSSNGSSAPASGRTRSRRASSPPISAPPSSSSSWWRPTGCSAFSPASRSPSTSG